MIVEKGETLLFVRELYNIESHAGEVDFGRSLALRQFPPKLVKRMDIYAGRTFAGRLLGRLEGKRGWFLANQYSPDQADWIDGDPSGAVRIFAIALLLYFGERVRLGPTIHLTCSPQGDHIHVVQQHRGQSWILPPCGPDEFTIAPGDVEPIRTLFEQLIKGFSAQLLRIPISRLMEASNIVPPSDALIDLSIALENLYLHSDSDKGKCLAERGAAFLGLDSATRQQIYLDLRSFYKARNGVLHDGQEHPTVSLKKGAPKDCVYLRDRGFEHLRNAIRKLLGDLRYHTMDKKSFVNELKNQAALWKAEFDRTEKEYIPRLDRMESSGGATGDCSSC